MLSASAAAAETLEQALTLGYQTNPTLQTERASLRGLNESYVQARAALRPSLSATVEADYDRGSPVQAGVVTVAGPQGADAATLSLDQTLYDGGRIGAGIRAAMDDILSERQKLKQTEASVLQSIVQAYVDVRRDGQALSIAEDNVKLLLDLLQNAQAQFEVGQYSRADLAEIQGRLAGAQTALHTARAQLAISRSTFLNVVGENPTDLAVEPPLPGLPKTLEEALAIAIRNNPGIAVAEFAEKAAAARVALAKGEFRPSLSLHATYGESGVLANPSSTRIDQPVGSYQREVIASAALTMPLFAGGLNGSRVRQAAEADTVQIIALETARRLAVEAVTQAWSLWQAARDNVSSGQDAVKADEIAYEGIVLETRFGERAPLEAVLAEQDLAASRLALNAAEHDQYVAAAGLLADMGLLEARRLVPDIEAYDPGASFDKVRRSGAVPWEGLVEGLDSVGAPRDPPRAAGPPLVLPPRPEP
jgi:outer membrane protein